MTDNAHPERQRRLLYGRRKGPKLSAHQTQLVETLLSKLALTPEPGRDPRNYFNGDVKDVWLEVGFGGGEHFLWQAQHHADIGMIGAEPYLNGIAKLLSSLAPAGGEGRGEGVAGRQKPESRNQNHAVDASNSEFERQSSDVEHPPHPDPLPLRGRGNIRIYTGDARDIIDALPDASLGRVFILFPDPWPKTRHHKRRFVQTELLDALARVMRRGAELRFASDDAPYMEWTLERLMAHPAFAWTARGPSDWLTRPEDWPPTRYEAKALHGKPAYLRFLRP